MTASVTSGVERFVYEAYPQQLAFHASSARHRLLGGAAGPGKTFALIMDHMLNCNQFSKQDAPEVHTLILRRTHPKLRATVITRFREKIPREIYSDYNEQSGIVTWLNGSSTQFGSMQYEHDVWGWQGQWYKIGYDELTEFTFSQWQNISAWNRCPVSKRPTKDGATNPIGIGADWVENLFVLGQPCKQMDKAQRERYHGEDYAYFPCTYRDNPIYANDPEYIENLRSYPARIREALMEGKWGLAGGYFEGAWDEAYNVYAAESVEILPHWRKWLSGDWGFSHNFAIYKHCIDDHGIVRTYGELVDNKQDSETLGESIAGTLCKDVDGKTEKFEFFTLSHDAFASTYEGHGINSRAVRIGLVMRKYGLPEPQPSTRDKIGREQLMYELLRKRVKLGIRRTAYGQQEAVDVGAWQIADTCKELIHVIPRAPRDEAKPEEIASYVGDDPLQGAGYGLYAWFGKPSRKPLVMRVTERIEAVQQARVDLGLPVQTDPSALYMISRKAEAEEKKTQKLVPLISSRWQRMRRR